MATPEQQKIIEDYELADELLRQSATGIASDRFDVKKLVKSGFADVGSIYPLYQEYRAKSNTASDIDDFQTFLNERDPRLSADFYNQENKQDIFSALENKRLAHKQLKTLLPSAKDPEIPFSILTQAFDFFEEYPEIPSLDDKDETYTIEGFKRPPSADKLLQNIKSEQTKRLDQYAIQTGSTVEKLYEDLELEKITADEFQAARAALYDVENKINLEVILEQTGIVVGEEAKERSLEDNFRVLLSDEQAREAIKKNRNVFDDPRNPLQSIFLGKPIGSVFDQISILEKAPADPMMAKVRSDLEQEKIEKLIKEQGYTRAVAELTVASERQAQEPVGSILDALGSALELGEQKFDINVSSAATFKNQIDANTKDVLSVMDDDQLRALSTYSKMSFTGPTTTSYFPGGALGGQIVNQDSINELNRRVIEHYSSQANSSARVYRAKLTREDFAKKLYPEKFKRQTPASGLTGAINQARSAKAELDLLYTVYELILPDEFTEIESENIKPLKSSLSAVQVLISSTADNDEKTRLNLIGDEIRSRSSGQGIIDFAYDKFGQDAALLASTLTDPRASAALTATTGGLSAALAGKGLAAAIGSGGTLLVPTLGAVALSGATYLALEEADKPIENMIDDIKASQDYANEILDGKEFVIMQPHRFLPQQKMTSQDLFALRMSELGYHKIANISPETLLKDLTKLQVEKDKIRGTVETTQVDRSQFRTAALIDSYENAKDLQVAVGDLPPSVQEILKFEGNAGTPLSEVLKQVELSEDEQITFNRAIARVKSEFQAQGFFTRSLGAYLSSAMYKDKYDPTSGMIYVNQTGFGNMMMLLAAGEEFVAEQEYLGIPIVTGETLGFPKQFKELDNSHPFISGQVSDLQDVSQIEAVIFQNNIQDFLEYLPKRKDGQPQVISVERLQELMNEFKDAEGNRPFADPTKTGENPNLFPARSNGPFAFLGRSLVISILNPDSFRIAFGTPAAVRKSIREQGIKGAALIGEEDLTQSERMIRNANTSMGWLGLMGVGQSFGMLGLTGRDKAVQVAETLGIIASTKMPDPGIAAVSVGLKGGTAFRAGTQAAVLERRLGASAKEAVGIGAATALETVGPKSRAVAGMLAERFNGVEVMADQQILIDALEETRIQADLPVEGREAPVDRTLGQRASDAAAAAGQPIMEASVLGLAGVDPIIGGALAATWWASKAGLNMVSKKMLDTALPTAAEIESGQVSTTGKMALAKQYYLNGNSIGYAAGLSMMARFLRQGGSEDITDSFYRGDVNAHKEVGILRDSVDKSMRSFGFSRSEVNAMLSAYQDLSDKSKAEIVSTLLNRSRRMAKQPEVSMANTIDGAISGIIHSNGYLDLKKSLDVKVQRGELNRPESEFFMAQVAVLAFAFPELKKMISDGTLVAVLESDSNLTGKKIVNFFAEEIDLSTEEIPKVYRPGESIPSNDVRIILNSRMTNAEQRYWRSRGLFDFVDSREKITGAQIEQWMETSDSEVIVSPQEIVFSPVLEQDQPVNRPISPAITGEEGEAPQFARNLINQSRRGNVAAKTPPQSEVLSTRNILKLDEEERKNIIAGNGFLYNNGRALNAQIVIKSEDQAPVRATDPNVKLSDGDTIRIQETPRTIGESVLRLDLPLNKVIARKIQGREGQWLTLLGPKQAERLIKGEQVVVGNIPRRAIITIDGEAVTDPTVIPPRDSRVQVTLFREVDAEDGQTLAEALDYSQVRIDELVEKGTTIERISKNQSGSLIEADVGVEFEMSLEERTGVMRPIVPKRIQIIAHSTRKGNLIRLEKHIKTRTNFSKEEIVDIIENGRTSIGEVPIEVEVLVDGEKVSDPKLEINQDQIIEIRFADFELAPLTEDLTVISSKPNVATIRNVRTNDLVETIGNDVEIEFNVVDRRGFKSIEITSIKPAGDRLSVIAGELREIQPFISGDQKVKAIDLLMRHYIDQGEVRRFRINNDAIDGDSQGTLNEVAAIVKMRDKGSGRRRGARIQQDSQQLKITHSRPYIDSILSYQGKFYTGNAEKLKVIPDQKPLGRLDVEIPEDINVQNISQSMVEKTNAIEEIENSVQELDQIINRTQRPKNLPALENFRRIALVSSFETTANALLDFVGRDYDGGQLTIYKLQKIKDLSRLTIAQQMAKQAIRGDFSNFDRSEGLVVYSNFVREVRRFQRQKQAEKAQLRAGILEGFYQLEYLEDSVNFEGLEKARESVGFEPSSEEPKEVITTNSRTVISRGATSSERIYSADDTTSQVSANTGLVDNKSAIFIDDVYSDEDPAGLRVNLIARHYDSMGLEIETLDAEEAIRKSNLNLIKNDRIFSASSPIRNIIRDIIKDTDSNNNRFEAIAVPRDNQLLSKAVATDLSLLGVTYRLEQRAHPSGLFYDVYFTNVSDTSIIEQRAKLFGEFDRKVKSELKTKMDVIGPDGNLIETVYEPRLYIQREKQFGIKDVETNPVSKRWAGESLETGPGLYGENGFDLDIRLESMITSAEDLENIKDKDVREFLRKELEQPKGQSRLHSARARAGTPTVADDVYLTAIFRDDTEATIETNPAIEGDFQITIDDQTLFESEVIELVRFAAGEGADSVTFKIEETHTLPFAKRIGTITETIERFERLQAVTSALNGLSERWGAVVIEIDKGPYTDRGFRIEITDEMKLSVPEGTNLFQEPRRVDVGDKVQSEKIPGVPRVDNIFMEPTTLLETYETGESKVIVTTPLANHINALEQQRSYLEQGLYSSDQIENYVSIESIRDIKRINISGQATLSDLIRSLGYLIRTMIDPSDYAKLTDLFDSVELNDGAKVLTRRGELQLAESIRISQDSPSQITDQGKLQVLERVKGVISQFNFTRFRNSPIPEQSPISKPLERFSPFAYADEISQVDQEVRMAQDEAVQDIIHRQVFTNVDAIAKVAQQEGFSVRDVIYEQGRVTETAGIAGEGDDPKMRARAAQRARQEGVTTSQEIIMARPSAWGHHLNSTLVIPERRRAQRNIVTRMMEDELGRPPTEEEVNARIESDGERYIPSGKDIDDAFFQLVEENGKIDARALYARVLANSTQKMIRTLPNVLQGIKYSSITARSVVRVEDQELYVAKSANEMYRIFGKTSDELASMVTIEEPQKGSYIPLERMRDGTHVPVITFRGEEAQTIAKKLHDLVIRMDASPINMTLNQSLRKRILAARKEGDLKITLPEITNEIRSSVIDLSVAHLSHRNAKLESGYVRPFQRLLVSGLSAFAISTAVSSNLLISAIIGAGSEVALANLGLKPAINDFINKYVLDIVPSVKHSAGVDKNVEEAVNELNRANQFISTLILGIIDDMNTAKTEFIEVGAHHESLNETVRNLRRKLNTPVSIDHLHLLEEIYAEISAIKFDSENARVFAVDPNAEIIVDGRLSPAHQQAFNQMKKDLTPEDDPSVNSNIRTIELAVLRERNEKSPILNRSKAQIAFQSLMEVYRKKHIKEPMSLDEFNSKRDLFYLVMSKDLNEVEQKAFDTAENVSVTFDNNGRITPDEAQEFQEALNVLYVGIERRYNKIVNQGKTIYQSVTGMSDATDRQAVLAYNLFFKGRFTRLDTDYRQDQQFQVPVPLDPGKGFTSSEIVRLARNNGFGKKDVSDQVVLQSLKNEMEKNGLVYDLSTVDGKKEAAEFAVKPDQDNMVLLDLDETRTTIGVELLDAQGKTRGMAQQANASMIALEIIVRFLAEENLYDFSQKITENYMQSKGMNALREATIREYGASIDMERVMQEEIINQVNRILQGENMNLKIKEPGSKTLRQDVNLNEVEQIAAAIAEDIIVTYQLNPKDFGSQRSKKDPDSIAIEILPDGSEVIMPKNLYNEIVTLIDDVAPVGRARLQKITVADDAQAKINVLNEALVLRSRIVDEATEALIREFNLSPEEARNAVHTYLVQQAPDHVRMKRQEMFNLEQMSELNDDVIRIIESQRNKTEIDVKKELEAEIGRKFKNSSRYRTFILGLGGALVGSYTAPFIGLSALFGVVAGAAISGYYSKKIINPARRRQLDLDAKISAFLDLEYSVIEAEALAGRLDKAKNVDSRFSTTYDESKGKFQFDRGSIGSVIGAIYSNKLDEVKYQFFGRGLTGKSEVVVDVIGGGLTGLLTAAYLGAGAAVAPGFLVGAALGNKRILRTVKAAVTVGVLLPTPAYFVANFIGAFFQAFTAVGLSGMGQMISFASSNPKFFKDVVGLMHGKVGRTKSSADSVNTFVTKDGRIYTPETFVAEANAYGIGSSFIKAELARSIQEDLITNNPASTRRLVEELGFKSWSETLVDFAQSTDNVFRVSMFMKEVNDGASPATAAQRVRDAFYDYGDLTPVEKNVLRQLVLFYAFLRKNQAQVSRVLLENPDRIARQLRFAYRSQQRALREEYDPEAMAEGETRSIPRSRELGYLKRPELYVDEFYQSRVFLPFFTDIVEIVEKSQQAFIYKDLYDRKVYFLPALPAQDAVNLFIDIFGFFSSEDSKEALLNLASPPVQMAVGEFTGEQAFGGKGFDRLMIDERLVYLMEDLTSQGLFGPLGSGAYVEYIYPDRYYDPEDVVEGVRPEIKRKPLSKSRNLTLQVASVEDGKKYFALMTMAQGLKGGGELFGRTQANTLDLLSQDLNLADGTDFFSIENRLRPGFSLFDYLMESTAVGRQRMIKTTEGAIESQKRTRGFKQQ